ncbi:MAG: type II toxin-antitoxin system HicA family toxin [Bacteroidota bacterium]
MKIEQVINLLHNDGWKLVRIKGSHRQFKHPDKRGLVTVSGKPSDEMKKGTLQSVLRQAGLK